MVLPTIRAGPARSGELWPNILTVHAEKRH